MMPVNHVRQCAVRIDGYNIWIDVFVIRRKFVTTFGIRAYDMADTENEEMEFMYKNPIIRHIRSTMRRLDGMLYSKLMMNEINMLVDRLEVIAKLKK